jgi:hypothetical protein
LPKYTDFRMHLEKNACDSKCRTLGYGQTHAKLLKLYCHIEIETLHKQEAETEYPLGKARFTKPSL